MEAAKKIFERFKNYEFIVLIVLSVLVMVIKIYEASLVLEYFLNIIVAGLVLTSVWLLFLDNYRFASYLILGLVSYFSGFLNLIYYIFSLNFGGMMTRAFYWPSLLQFLGTLYLVVMIFYYFFRDGFKLNKQNFYLDPLILVFCIFALLNYGIEGFVYIAFIELIAINYKKESSLALMLSKAVVPIFTFLIIIVDFGARFLTLYNIGMLFLSLALIALIVLKGVDVIFNKSRQEEETVEIVG